MKNILQHQKETEPVTIRTLLKKCSIFKLSLDRLGSFQKMRMENLEGKFFKQRFSILIQSLLLDVSHVI